MAAERHFTKMPDVPQGMEALMRIENAVMLRKFQWQGSETKITDFCRIRKNFYYI